MKTMIERFLEDTSALLGTIQAAAARHDAPTIQHAAHKLRSSSMIVAAVGLADRCADLELAAETGGPADLDGLVSAVADEFGRVGVVLRQHVGGD